MHASLDPVVEHPVAPVPLAFQRRARMFTHRRSISAVCGYSSLSIMFFEAHSVMSSSASGSIQVVTNVARFRRALPSSINSSWMIWKAIRGGRPLRASRMRGTWPISPCWLNCGRKLSSSSSAGSVV